MYQKLRFAQKKLMNTITPIRTLRIFYFLIKRPKTNRKKLWFSSNTKITKTEYISKTKNRTKKIMYEENECQVNSNLCCKIGHF